MYADFPEKYEELREYMRLKHAKEFSNRQRGIYILLYNKLFIRKLNTPINYILIFLCLKKL